MTPPTLFTILDHSNLPARTRTIANFITRQARHTGHMPSINQVAETFAMHPTRVLVHFKRLGLAQQ